MTLDGWEGPLDLLLNLARAQKVDLAQISILAAGRAISRLSRRGAGAEARDRRRLSGDGGVARLPQILPAAAQGPRAGPEPRGDRAAAADAAAAARRDARGRRAAARPRPASAATCSCAARPKGCGWSASRRGRCAISTCSPPMARSARAPQPAMHVVHARSVMTLEEAHRAGRADDRHGARLDLPRELPARDPGPAVPPLGAGLELRRRARARAARPARPRPGRAVRADQAQGPPDGRVHARRRSDPVRVGRRRSASTRSPSMSAKAMSRSRSASSPRIMKAAGSSWSSAAGAGISRPRPTSPICCAGRARSRGGCRARRPRRWRSSPITSRSAAPRSRRSAASRSPRARSTC